VKTCAKSSDVRALLLALSLVAVLPACGQQLVEFPTTTTDGPVADVRDSGGGADTEVARDSVVLDVPDGPDLRDGSPDVVDGAPFPDAPPGDGTAPVVIVTVPAPGGTGFPTNGAVIVTFSEPMDPATLNMTTFTLAQGATAVAGMVNPVGATAVFTPTVALTASTTYTATVTTGAKDVAGNALAATYTWTFTTGTALDATAPTVISTIPAPGAPNVPRNAAVGVVFSEAMAPATVNTTTFTLRQGATVVAGSVNPVGATAVFTPTSALAASTVYTATITTGVKDIAGNAMAVAYTWTFTTAMALDTTAPTVLTTVPGTNATNAARNGAVGVAFSEPMDPASLNGTTFTLKQGTTLVAGSLSPVGAALVFTPSAALAASTVYTGTITTGARDIAGNALAATYTWSFTTTMALDTTAPTVLTFTPGRDATNVSVNAPISVAFSEPVDPATVNGTTFVVTQGNTVVAGMLSPVGSAVVFTPSSPLDPSTIYTVTITTGAKDIAGNPLAAPTTWSFTTGLAADTTAPAVFITVPGRGAMNVPANTAIVVTFTEAMDPMTLNGTTFTVKDGLDTVPGMLSPVGAVVIFTPTMPLDASTTYTVTVTTGAKDVAGNGLAMLDTWDFTTGVALDTTPPTVMSTIPGPGALNVAIWSKPTATFSEPMQPATINMLSFTLQRELLPPVPVGGTVSYDLVTRAATFDPDSDLAVNATYRATITTMARDLAGNAMVLEHTWTFTTAACGQSAITLGAAGNFVVLAGSTVTSTGLTMVLGNLGVSPGTAVTGFPPGTVSGAQHKGNPTSALAIFDLTTAYNEAAGRVLCPVSLSGNLGGMTLPPGLYKSTTSFAVSSGDLTLDAQGDGDAVFIFQMASTLTTTSGRQVLLIGGAKAKNVFWQVGSSATLGTTSVFVGTIMADQAITMETGASLTGRVLARIAAVALDTNMITPPAP
jgi:hypothetical protein